jgi:hypothetical protein
MADDLKPAYLIAGGDRPKVDRAVDRLRARFEPDAVELHDAPTRPATTRSPRATRSGSSAAAADSC